MKLSICMMVKDEEKNLVRCLDSLEVLRKSVSSELIIIDTGSKDKTVDIAKRYTKHVFHHPWNNNFSEMRNISLSYAKGEWVFLIDADEELQKIDSMVNFLTTKHDDEIVGATLLLKNLRSQYSDEIASEMITARIFRNNVGLRYEGRVHNNAVIEGAIMLVDSEILHYGYISDDEDLMERKYQRTKTLLLEELDENPDDIYYRYQLATTYGMRKKRDLAFREISKAYQQVKSLEGAEEYRRYLYVIAAYAKDAYNYNKPDEVIESCQWGIELEKDMIDLYYFCGNAYLMKNYFLEGIDYLEKYLNLLNHRDKLKVRYDPSIQFYSLGAKLSVQANLVSAYLLTNQYEKSYTLAKIVEESDESISDDICHIIIEAKVKAIIYLEKKNQLLNLFKDYSNKENQIIECIESCINNIDENSKKSILKILSSLDNEYGEFNRLRLNIGDSFNARSEALLLKYVEEKNAEAFYLSIYYKVNIKKMVVQIYEVELMQMLSFLEERYNDFEHLVINYLQEVAWDNEYVDLYFKRNLYKYLFIKNIENDKGYLYFNDYLQVAMEEINYKYRVEFIHSTACYSIDSAEQQYIISMIRILSFNQKIDLDKALDVMPEWGQMTARWINEYYHVTENNDTEMENLMKQLKDNIHFLYNNKQFQEAVQLIEEYLKLKPNDIEMHDYKAKIIRAMN